MPAATSAAATADSGRGRMDASIDGSYFRPRMYVIAAFKSASLILSGGLGDIGTGPHTPEPPLRTFSNSLAAASAWPAYFFATSLYDGPTIFLSSEWQARQPAFFIASGSAARALAVTKHAASAMAVMGSKVFMFGSVLFGTAFTSMARQRRASVLVEQARQHTAGGLHCPSIDVVLGVVHVEVTGRGDQLRVLDDLLQLQRLVVDDDQRALLVLRAPHREPDLVAGLVELRLHHALGAVVAQPGPLGDRQHGEALVQVLDVEHRHRLRHLRVRVERRVDVQVLRLRVRLQEQAAAALTLDLGHLLERRVLALGVGGDERDRLVAEVTGGPHRAELRMHEVRAAARVRDLADLDQARELAVLGVDHRDLVAVVGRHHEVALRRVQPAVMQELRGLDLGGLQRIEVRVVDQHRLARLLH